MDPNKMRTVNLLTCNNVQEASIIKGRLENEGIPCFLTNENITTIAPYLNGLMGSGTQIMVFEQDLETAIQLIRPTLTNVLKCPYCDSENVKFGFKKFRNIFSISLVIVFISTMLRGSIKGRYHCIDCHKDFMS